MARTHSRYSSSMLIECFKERYSIYCQHCHRIKYETMNYTKSLEFKLLYQVSVFDKICDNCMQTSESQDGAAGIFCHKTCYWEDEDEDVDDIIVDNRIDINKCLNDTTECFRALEQRYHFHPTLVVHHLNPSYQVFQIINPPGWDFLWCQFQNWNLCRKLQHVQLQHRQKHELEHHFFILVSVRKFFSPN